MTSGRARVVQGDGWRGYASMAPFDAIHVGAAASQIPRALLRQLKVRGWDPNSNPNPNPHPNGEVGGRMLIPVGDESQALLQVANRNPNPYLNPNPNPNSNPNRKSKPQP